MKALVDISSGMELWGCYRELSKEVIFFALNSCQKRKDICGVETE